MYTWLVTLVTSSIWFSNKIRPVMIFEDSYDWIVEISGMEER
jgi:hypothetical protein